MCVIAAQFISSSIVGIFWCAIVLSGSVWIRRSAKKSDKNGSLVLAGAAISVMLGMVFGYAILLIFHRVGW